MSGHVGDLSPKQAACLEQLREIVKDVLKPEQIHDDYYLTRWLRARNFDLKNTETMLRKHMLWRKQYNVDRVFEDFEVPEVIEKYYPGGMCGVDKEWFPVWFDLIGLLDLKGILRSSMKRDVIMARVAKLGEYYSILLDELGVKTGKTVDQITVIMDFDKFGLKHMWKPGLDAFSECAQMFEDNYPERLRRVYIINAPRLFPIVFNILKPFLSETTISKIQILGTNYKKELLNYIDPDQLPKYWGGICTDPDGDPRCLSKINFGGDIPIEYYKQCDIKEMENSCEVAVGRGSSLQLDYTIKVSNSMLRWQFTTEGFDIGFGVYKKNTAARLKSANMEKVLVSQRVNSHFVPEDGSLSCREPGIYVVRFDNTYSWTRTKTIHYIIDVVEPDEALDSTMTGEMNEVYTSTQEQQTTYSPTINNSQIDSQSDQSVNKNKFEFSYKF